jgi:acyl-CoA thioesterase I
MTHVFPSISCKKGYNDKKYYITNQGDRRMKIVCIGNSIVKGFPHRQGQSFPSVLRERTGWQVINKGANGDTTTMVLHRFPRDVLAHQPDKVLILTGTNDFIYQTASPVEAMDNIDQMIDLARGNGIEPVLFTPILSNPAQAATQWMAGAAVDYQLVNEKLGELSMLIRCAAAARGCKLVDLELKYKGFGKYHDGIHPTVEGQEWIAQVILEEI